MVMEGKRRAIIFDADNTLYRTREIARDADMSAMRVLARYCKGCTPIALYNQFRKIVALLIKSQQPYHRTRLHSYSILAARYGIPHRRVPGAVGTFRKAVLRSLRPMSGILPFLRAAKHQGFHLIVITEDSATFAAAKLRRLRLSRFFDAVISADTVGQMKPHRKYLDLALKRARVSAHDAIVIGDDFEKDLADAKQRGAFTILIGAKDARAAKSVSSYAGLQKYLH